MNSSLLNNTGPKGATGPQGVQSIQGPPGPTGPACNFLVYVTNAGAIDDPTDDTVPVINTGTNTVVATNTVIDTVPVGVAPTGIATGTICE